MQCIVVILLPREWKLSFYKTKNLGKMRLCKQVLADMKEGQGDFAVLDLRTVGEQFFKFLSNNLVCECYHAEDEARVSD